ncbi:hypothetical protein HDU93_001660 [Gonapodya sp. JEL0774]|nr:hypothetical protein HDU93_001660 [Gonapodya sp. JEL0774]
MAKSVRYTLICEDSEPRDLSMFKKILRRCCKDKWEEVVLRNPLQRDKMPEVDVVIIHRGSLLEVAPQFEDSLGALLAARKVTFFEFGYGSAYDLHRVLQRKAKYLDVMWPTDGGGFVGISLKALVACDDLLAVLNLLHRLAMQRQLENEDKPWRFVATSNVLGRMKLLATVLDPSLLKGNVFSFRSFLSAYLEDTASYDPSLPENNPFKCLASVVKSDPSKFVDDTYQQVEFAMLTNRSTLRRSAVIVTADEQSQLSGGSISEYGTELVGIHNLESWVRKEVGGDGKLYTWEDAKPDKKDNGAPHLLPQPVHKPPQQHPVPPTVMPGFPQQFMGVTPGMGMGYPQPAPNFLPVGHIPQNYYGSTYPMAPAGSGVPSAFGMQPTMPGVTPGGPSVGGPQAFMSISGVHGGPPGHIATQILGAPMQGQYYGNPAMVNPGQFGQFGQNGVVTPTVAPPTSQQPQLVATNSEMPVYAEPPTASLASQSAPTDHSPTAQQSSTRQEEVPADVATMNSAQLSSSYGRASPGVPQTQSVVLSQPVTNGVPSGPVTIAVPSPAGQELPTNTSSTSGIQRISVEPTMVGAPQPATGARQPVTSTVQGIPGMPAMAHMQSMPGVQTPPSLQPTSGMQSVGDPQFSLVTQAVPVTAIPALQGMPTIQSQPGVPMPYNMQYMAHQGGAHPMAGPQMQPYVTMQPHGLAGYQVPGGAAYLGPNGMHAQMQTLQGMAGGYQGPGGAAYADPIAMQAQMQAQTQVPHGVAGGYQGPGGAAYADPIAMQAQMQAQTQAPQGMAGGYQGPGGAAYADPIAMQAQMQAPQGMAGGYQGPSGAAYADPVAMQAQMQAQTQVPHGVAGGYQGPGGAAHADPIAMQAQTQAPQGMAGGYQGSGGPVYQDSAALQEHVRQLQFQISQMQQLQPHWGGMYHPTQMGMPQIGAGGAPINGPGMAPMMSMYNMGLPGTFVHTGGPGAFMSGAGGPGPFMTGAPLQANLAMHGQQPQMPAAAAPTPAANPPANDPIGDPGTAGTSTRESVPPS